MQCIYKIESKKSMGFASTDQQDYDKGIAFLKLFHEFSQEYPNYTYTFDELIDSLAPNKSQAVKDIKVQGLGLLINSNDMSDSKMYDTAYEISKQGRGMIPTDYNVWSNALARAAQDYSFFDALSFTTKESVKDIVETGSNAVSAVSSIGKNYKLILILVALGLSAFVLFKVRSIRKLL